MNLDKARHLENILRENDNNGIAIAITGSWGVGKTFFWKKFLEKNARSEQERNFLPYSIKRKFPNFFDKNMLIFRCLG